MFNISFLLSIFARVDTICTQQYEVLFRSNTGHTAQYAISRDLIYTGYTRQYSVFDSWILVIMFNTSYFAIQFSATLDLPVFRDPTLALMGKGYSGAVYLLHGVLDISTEY